MGSEAVRVLVADDHPVVLEGLISLLKKQPTLAVVAAATNGSDAVALYRHHRPDVALLDLRMPAMSGIQALGEIRAFDRAARVVMLSTFDGDEDIHRAIEAGARAYLLKEMTCEELTAAILRVYAGERVLLPTVEARLAERLSGALLTTREVDVLALAARGEKNKQIGARLGITEGTVKGYVAAILVKLGAQDRTDAAIIGLRRGIIPPPRC
jgi:two-component system NarL family response regulator